MSLRVHTTQRHSRSNICWVGCILVYVPSELAALTGMPLVSTSHLTTSSRSSDPIAAAQGADWYSISIHT
jgi:hypothetical protein